MPQVLPCFMTGCLTECCHTERLIILDSRALFICRSVGRVEHGHLPRDYPCTVPIVGPAWRVQTKQTRLISQNIAVKMNNRLFMSHIFLLLLRISFTVYPRGGRVTEHKTHLIYNKVLTTVIKEKVKVIRVYTKTCKCSITIHSQENSSHCILQTT